MDAAGKFFAKRAGHFHAESRFADTAGSGDRHQAHLRPQQEICRGSGFFLSADEARARYGELAGSRPRMRYRVLRSGLEFADRSHKTISPARDCVDELRLLGIVVEHLA